MHCQTLLIQNNYDILCLWYKPGLVNPRMNNVHRTHNGEQSITRLFRVTDTQATAVYTKVSNIAGKINSHVAATNARLNLGNMALSQGNNAEAVRWYLLHLER